MMFRKWLIFGIIIILCGNSSLSYAGKIEAERLRLQIIEMSEDQEWEKRINEDIAEQQEVKSKMMGSLRKATASEYRNWLNGYLKLGKKATHVYSYEFPSDFYVAIEDMEIDGLYGAMAIKIIVPVGINVTIKERGHSNIYYMSDHTHIGFCVPIYKDL